MNFQSNINVINQGIIEKDKLVKNPFLDNPPKYVRMEYYRYNFEKPSEENVWKREKIGTWFGPVSKDTSGLREFIIANNWQNYD